MNRSAIAIVLMCLFTICVSAADDAAPRQATSLAYVLDSPGQTVTALDLNSGKTIATTKVSGRQASVLAAQPALDTLVLTPDKSRLIRVDPGEQKFTWRFGLHPLEKSSLTLIDPKTMQVIEHIDVGWGLSNFKFTPDNKILVALCRGYHSQKPEETLSAELVTVNIAKGREQGRLALSREPLASVLTRDGRTAMLLYPEKLDKHAPAVAAELQFVNVEDLSTAGSIKVDGSPNLPVLSANGDYLYLIEQGQPAKKKNGSIHVISVKNMKEESVVDAGWDPRGLLQDDAGERVLLLSNAPFVKGEKNADGEMRVIRGASVANVVKVPHGAQFLRVSADRKRLYVVGFKEVSAIDYDTFHELGRMSGDGAMSELALSPDGKHGFGLHPASSKLSLLDLQDLKAEKSVTTGRGSIKFAKHLAAAAATTGSVMSAQASASYQAQRYGYGYATYTVFTVAPANTTLAIRPDGAFVYVLNSQTNDVTVVNTATGEVVDKIAAGGYRLRLLNGGGVLAVLTRNSIHRVDTAAQKELPGISLGKNLVDIKFSPDGKNAVALVNGSVLLLDGSTGEVKGRVEGFNRPTVALFPNDDREPDEETIDDDAEGS